MQEIISSQHVGQWAKDFIDELFSVKKKNKELQKKIIVRKNFNEIKEAYQKAQKRLIILDYDGTLVSFHRNPMKASPTTEVIDLLKKMCADSHNRMIISSGRDKQAHEVYNIIEK